MLSSDLAKPSTPGRSFRGSITRPISSLSTLRSPGHPGTTQDSLPACWLHFGRGWDFHPLGSTPTFRFSSISFLSGQACPGARPTDGMIFS